MNNHKKPRSFLKKTYSSWKSFWDDFRYLMAHREQIRAAMRSELVTVSFRERLMLAVTEVNQCRYCRAFHVQQALQAGITDEEIRLYLSGSLPESIPEEQRLAVAFATTWAEEDGLVDSPLEDQLRNTYGERGVAEIQIILRLIRMGNLLGNTWDYILFRVSCGRWGV